MGQGARSDREATAPHIVCLGQFTRDVLVTSVALPTGTLQGLDQYRKSSRNMSLVLDVLVHDSVGVNTTDIRKDGV